MRRSGAVLFLGIWTLIAHIANALDGVFPGEVWETRTPQEMGLAPAKLDAVRDYLQGRGCVIRHGFLVYSWGDITLRKDIASAVKPWISHFLFKSVEEGKLPSLDTTVRQYQPCLFDLNAALGYKDRDITFRHLANQVSCYGVKEAPGTAYDYNDWQTALLFDTLFLKIYGIATERIDDEVLHPQLTDILQCEDHPTFLAFGADHHPGRLAISPRDLARFGLLYLHSGNWKGHPLISPEHVKMAVSSPLPNSIPRTTAEEAEMCPDKRSLGSERIPDDQSEHYGSYSWFWWLNWVDKEGKRRWPSAPIDTYAALGHSYGMRGMAVIPTLDLVISWNDTALGDYPSEPHPLDRVFQLLCN
jgi:CubicO group peptidase (beta-lactamase class C family)